MPKAGEMRPIETTPGTTEILVSNRGLEELLKKIGGLSLDDLHLTHGATEQPLFMPIERLDKYLQVFLGVQDKREAETKPTYDGSIEDEQEIGGSTDARIFPRAPGGKPQIQNIYLSMWVAAKARIMHKLTNTGKLSGMAQIEDYHSYTGTVKVQCSKLLESHTLSLLSCMTTNITNFSTSTAFAGALNCSIPICSFS